MPSESSEHPPFRWNLRCSGTETGPALLWFHGFMGSMKDWEAEILPHFQGYRNILLDLPGHGGSIMPASLNIQDVCTVMAHQLAKLSINSVTVIAYSMGGRIALHFQHFFPGLVNAFVGLSVAPGLKTEAERTLRRISDEALMDRLETSGHEDFLKQWYASPLFQTLGSDPDVLAKMIQRRSGQEPDQLRRSLRSFGNGALPSLWDKLPDMDFPILLITGEEDLKYCEINDAMVKDLSQGERVNIPGASHAFHLEKPFETAMTIRQFLSNTTEGANRV